MTVVPGLAPGAAQRRVPDAVRSAVPTRAAVRPLRPRTVLVLTFAVICSLVPSVLPRPAVLQGVLTGVMLAGAWSAEAMLGRRSADRPPSSERTAWWVLAVAMSLVGLAAYWTDGHLGRSRAALGLSAQTGEYWPVAAAAGLLVCLLVVGAARMLCRMVAGLRARRGRLAALGVVLAVLAAGPQLTDLGWAALGSSSGEDELVRMPRSRPAVRVYVRLDEAPTAADRAALAVDRLERLGGLDRGAVVVAVPTGSGWVNPEAVAGLERAAGGDLATVAVQGGSAPSWLELALRPGEHEASARAVLDAVTARVNELPRAGRPRVYLLGESLGALVGRRLLTEETSSAAQVCGAVWAGVPGGASAGSPAVLVHGNRDDPVVYWRPALLTRRPAGWPAPLWVPGLSYLAVTVDLLASLGPPPGHGHRYGAEQDWALPEGCRAPRAGPHLAGGTG